MWFTMSYGHVVKALVNTKKMAYFKWILERRILSYCLLNTASQNPDYVALTASGANIVQNSRLDPF